MFTETYDRFNSGTKFVPGRPIANQSQLSDAMSRAEHGDAVAAQAIIECDKTTMNAACGLAPSEQ